MPQQQRQQPLTADTWRSEFRSRFIAPLDAGRPRPGPVSVAEVNAEARLAALPEADRARLTDATIQLDGFLRGRAQLADEVLSGPNAQYFSLASFGPAVAERLRDYESVAAPLLGADLAFALRIALQEQHDL